MTTKVELDGAARQWYAAYLVAKERADTAAEEMKRCREHLEAAIGDADDATVDGKLVITYRWSKPTERIDVKALREKEPDLAAQFTVTGTPTRSFRLADG